MVSDFQSAFEEAIKSLKQVTAGWSKQCMSRTSFSVLLKEPIRLFLEFKGLEKEGKRKRLHQG